MTTEAELAQKLRDEVFSPAANAVQEEEPAAEPDEEQPDEETETEAEPEGAGAEEEVEAEREPTPERQEEEVAEPEPKDEPEEPEDFYVEATDRIRYKTREEAEQALREQAATIGRQSQEVGQMRAQLAQQAEQLNTMQLQMQFATLGSTGLSPDEAAYVDQALEAVDEASDAPAAFIQEALQVGNLSLASAICDAWEVQDPLRARQARGVVDGIKQRADQLQRQQQGEQQPRPTEELYAYLVQSVPDIAQYEEMMQTVAGEIPDEHWISKDLVNGDEAARLRSLHAIYELAKARSIGVAAKREQIKANQKQKDASARKRAAVASGQASAGGRDTPRDNTALFRENMRDVWRQQGLIARE